MKLQWGNWSYEDKDNETVVGCALVSCVALIFSCLAVCVVFGGCGPHNDKPATLPTAPTATADRAPIAPESR